MKRPADLAAEFGSEPRVATTQAKRGDDVSANAKRTINEACDEFLRLRGRLASEPNPTKPTEETTE